MVALQWDEAFAREPAFASSELLAERLARLMSHLSQLIAMSVTCALATPPRFLL